MQFQLSCIYMYIEAKSMVIVIANCICQKIAFNTMKYIMYVIGDNDKEVLNIQTKLTKSARE